MQFVFANCTSKTYFIEEREKNPKILSKLKWRISLLKWLQQILSFILMVSVIKRMSSSCAYMQMGRIEKFRTHVYFHFLEFHKEKKKFNFQIYSLCVMLASPVRNVWNESLQGGKKKIERWTSEKFAKTINVDFHAP